MESWGFGKWAAVVLGSLALIFGLIVVGHGIAYGEWQINWWYAQHNMDRQTSLVYHSLSNQSALREEIQNGITQVDKDTSYIANAKAQGLTDYANSLKPARNDAANTVCGQIVQLSKPGDIPAFLAWGRANCSNGSLSPNSKYYYAGG